MPGPGGVGRDAMIRQPYPFPLASAVPQNPSLASHQPLSIVEGEQSPPGQNDTIVGPWQWLFWVVLVLAVLLVYQPAWQGGILWDDDAHVTRPELRSWHGLWRIWFDVGATLQYYPLLHSAFWIEHQLWGDATLGYHLVNILCTRRPPCSWP